MTGEIRRGDVWWANLREPRGSEPGTRRPVVIVQADSFNKSAIDTTLALVVSSNLRLAEAPGNVRITRRHSRLSRESVVNVSQILTLDKGFLDRRVGRLSGEVMDEIDAGLRLVLDLGVLASGL